ncbi:MAG: hypothetical protein AMS21_00940 [Gemmatimonas sp. SG8_38_2]|nr:MAG: hypothetical protein AMS21_00940 [Gemmatimonas sp. SG8_38_2]
MERLFRSDDEFRPFVTPEGTMLPPGQRVTLDIWLPGEKANGTICEDQGMLFFRTTLVNPQGIIMIDRDSGQPYFYMKAALPPAGVIGS